MKNLTCVILVLTVFFFSCKKDKNDGWSDEERASYNAVITLQDQAAENYTTWMQTMDSLEVINQLQQFFLSDPSVISATIGSQGIAVEYTNGMGGGIFLNPKNYSVNDTGMVLRTIEGQQALKSIPVVNNNEMILLDPHYFDRHIETDHQINNFNLFLPKVGYALSRTYLNDEADVDEFTKLSGYGIIEIYAHGWAWPDESDIKDVFVMTGEEANEETAEVYFDEIKRKEIIVADCETMDGINSIFWISEKFIAGHNDFSEDTVLFIGAFCYSFLGNWPKIQQSFAAGAYFGFDWSVKTLNCVNWATSLITSLADPVQGYPWTSVDWFDFWDPSKSYYDEEDHREVNMLYVGDTLLLWENPPPDVETMTASGVSGSDATLNAAINPQGSNTKAMFEYGLTTDYGMTAAITQNQLTGKEWIDVHADISGLLSNTTYHFRIRATCNSGVSLGEDMTLATNTLPPYLESKDYGLYVGMLNYWLCPDSASAGQYIYIPRYFNASEDYIKCKSDGSGNISINWTSNSETCTGSGSVMPHHIEIAGWMLVNYYSFNIAFEYNYQGPLSYKYTGSITGIGHLDTYFTSRQLACSGTMTLYWKDGNGDPQECSYPKSFPNQSDLHDFGK